MQIIIRPDKSSTKLGDPFDQLGEIVLRSSLFQMATADRALTDSEVTIGGRRYVITDADLVSRGDAEPTLTIEIAPASNDPFDQTREEKQPEW